MKRLFTLWVVLGVMIYTPAGFAANFKIVAKVNDNAISNYVLEERVAMMMKSANVPNNAEARRTLRNQALQTLINEELQMQDAARFNIEVSDEDLEAAKAELERQNGVDKGGFDKFIRAQGISPNAVLKQIKAQITWQKLVNNRIASRVQVDDEEVAEVRHQYKDIPARKEVFLAEIVLAVDEGDDLSAIKSMAADLYKRIQKGEKLSDLAKQFSVSNTAAEGGRVGWFKVDDLRGSLQQRAQKAKKGATFPPEYNKQRKVFRILQVLDKRDIGKAIKRTDNDVKNILRRKRIEKQAQAYMKKLRQDAFIEFP